MTTSSNHNKLIKGFNLYSRFEAILQEQRNVLFSKNYSEKMIGSAMQNGFFFGQLRAAFAQRIAEHLWEPHIERFSLEMTGRFGPHKSPSLNDSVAFRFTYAYDNVRVALQIVHLTATLNQEEVAQYPIVNHPSKNLPTAGNVYKELHQKRTQRLLAAITPEKKKISKTSGPKIKR